MLVSKRFFVAHNFTFTNNRKHSIIRATHDNRTIFQVENAFVDVTLTDVEDLLESYAYTKEKQYKRNDMVDHFYSNGVDYDRVVKYYSTVKSLNYSLKMSEPRTLSQNIKDFLTVFMISFQIMCNIAVNIALNINTNIKNKRVRG